MISLPQSGDQRRNKRLNKNCYSNNYYILSSSSLELDTTWGTQKRKSSCSTPLVLCLQPPPSIPPNAMVTMGPELWSAGAQLSSLKRVKPRWNQLLRSHRENANLSPLRAQWVQTSDFITLKGIIRKQLRMPSTPSRAKHTSADTNYYPSGENRKEKAPYLSLVVSFTNAHPASLKSRRHITQMHVPHHSRIRIVLTELYIEKSSQCTHSAPSITKHTSSLPMPKNSQSCVPSDFRNF